MERTAWTDERIDDMVDHHDNTLERIDRRFDAVDRRFEAVERRFEQVDRRFEQVDRRFEAVDRQFELVHQELRALDARMAEGFTSLRRDMLHGFLVLSGALVATLATVVAAAL